MEVTAADHVARVVRAVLQDYAIVVRTTSVVPAHDGWDVTIRWGPATVKRIHLQRGSPAMLRLQIIRELGI
jgi:hypothetical protein